MFNQTAWNAPQWCQALTLTERITDLRAARRAVPQTTNGRSTALETNPTLAERRLQRWRTQTSFTTEALFTQRLAADKISEAELFLLLGEPIKAVSERSSVQPAWLADLATAFATSGAGPLTAASDQPIKAGPDLLVACELLVQQGRQRLHEGIQALGLRYSQLPFAPNTIEALLLAHLPDQLTPMVSRTMALELNIARLQGLLVGETPEERFCSFVQRLRDPATALDFLQEYPVLARQLTCAVERWVTTSLEFLQRLCTDQEAIQQLFCPETALGVLTQIQGGMGDPHRGGHSVLIATFSTGLQVVYKPRSLAVDVHFQALLNWLNARGDHPAFRTLRVWDCGAYGWSEFVAHESCTCAAEIERFYRRQGGYLALLYILAATDFHHENLIAAGEHPVLLDLEALFHPRHDHMDGQQAEQSADTALFDSVLGVGLLPRRIWSNGGAEGVDLSGLGGAAGQWIPYQVPQWEKLGTDEMHLTRKRVMTRGAQNRPLLNGAEVNPIDYAAAIMAGFRQVYGVLLKHRADLLAVDGPLACFAQVEVRVILRATRTYSMLLRESFHPDVLRNALDRDRLFDRLWGCVAECPHLAQIISAERAALEAGDIPLFITRPAAHALWSSDNQRLGEFFAESGMTLVQRRLQQLGDLDLARQLWIIHASLATLTSAVDYPAPLTVRGAAPQPAAEAVHVHEQHKCLLAAACAVGNRLETLALRGAHNVSWLGVTLEQDQHWSLTPLGIDLYGGLSGVALFLAYLGKVTETAHYTALAKAAADTLRSQLAHSQFIKLIGGFSGWGSVIYTLAHLGMLWKQPTLWAEAAALVERLPALIEQDDQFDVIGGAAGCIGSLLALERCSPSARTLAVARQCGDWLLAHAQPQPHGIGWVTPLLPKPLAGFAHGGAGIAWALLKLADVTGEPRFQIAACAALSYERSLFSPQAENWPDLRKKPGPDQAADAAEPHFMTAWCHGAVGIGLARLQALPLLDDPELRIEIDTALRTTLTAGFGHNHSLCHGDLGNLELLLQASTTFADPQLRTAVEQAVEQRTALILTDIERNGWRCGLPLGLEAPSFMTGLAGIGYGLLRLAEPMRVPAVLMLAPPLVD